MSPLQLPQAQPRAEPGVRDYIGSTRPFPGTSVAWFVFKRHPHRCNPCMPSLRVFKLSGFVGSPPVPDIPGAFPGGQFVSPDAVCFSKVLMPLVLVLGPAPAERTPVPSILPPSVPRTKAQACGRRSSSSGLTGSDDTWGGKRHRIQGHIVPQNVSPPRGPSPQRGLHRSYCPTRWSAPFSLLSAASCLSVPAHAGARGTPTSCATATLLPSHFTSPCRLASSQLAPQALCRGITSSEPQGPSRDVSRSRRAVTPGGELLPRDRRQRRLQSTWIIAT